MNAVRRRHRYAPFVVDAAFPCGEEDPAAARSCDFASTSASATPAWRPRRQPRRAADRRPARVRDRRRRGDVEPLLPLHALPRGADPPRGDAVGPAHPPDRDVMSALGRDAAVNSKAVRVSRGALAATVSRRPVVLPSPCIIVRRPDRATDQTDIASPEVDRPHGGGGISSNARADPHWPTRAYLVAMRYPAPPLAGMDIYRRLSTLLRTRPGSAEAASLLCQTRITADIEHVHCFVGDRRGVLVSTRAGVGTREARAIQ